MISIVMKLNMGADEEHEEMVCVSCNNINAGHPQFFLCLHTEPNLASISEIKPSGPGSRSDQIASIVSFSDHWQIGKQAANLVRVKWKWYTPNFLLVGLP